MKTLSYLVVSIVVLALAFWAYHVNYATKDRLAELRALNGEIADLQEGLSVLRAEWAYLNRPDRLRELVNLNFSSLQLLPLAPEQFGAVSQVPYPLPPEATQDLDSLGVSEAIDVMAAPGTSKEQTQ